MRNRQSELDMVRDLISSQASRLIADGHLSVAGDLLQSSEEFLRILDRAMSWVEKNEAKKQAAEQAA